MKKDANTILNEFIERVSIRLYYGYNILPFTDNQVKSIYEECGFDVNNLVSLVKEYIKYGITGQEYGLWYRILFYYMDKLDENGKIDTERNLDRLYNVIINIFNSRRRKLTNYVAFKNFKRIRNHKEKRTSNRKVKR